jgi:alpha-L-fucosidase
MPTYSLFVSLLTYNFLPTIIQAQAPPAPYLQTPSPRQLQWHALEYYAFLHFGPNTFTNEEWGTSQSTPDVFNPSSLDTDQWASTIADAGMSGMILTAKHHDGMCLWNTSTTTYKIENSAWAQNRSALGLDTDVVRMAAMSAEKYGLKFGVYLSPWDIHRDPGMPKPNLTGTIYDEPQIFGDESPGDYNEFYAQQLTELMTMNVSSINSTASVDGENETATEKVSLFEIWLDGASGSDTVQTFNWTLFRTIIRTHQPSAIMWGHQGVDARWVGNEDGFTLPTNWHTISRTQDDVHYGGEELETGVRDGLYWTPAESDARIRDGWFWHASEDGRVKNATVLMRMWEETVGRGVSLLLDVPPDSTGRIPEEDAGVLREFRELRDAFLQRDVLDGNMAVNASSVREGDEVLYGPANVLDNSSTTYWAVDPLQTTGALEVSLNGTYTVDAFIVQEHIALGQRIGGYTIDGFAGGAWQMLVNGTSMGYKRIDKLVKGVDVERIRLRITQANATPLVQALQVLGKKRKGDTGR